MSRFEEIRKTLTGILVLNLGVALAKGIFGFISGSLSMVADSFHSLLDTSSNVVGLVGVRIAQRPPDVDHPYGHRKYETLATVGISILLLLAAFQIFRGAIERFSTGSRPTVTVFSFIIMLGTMAINGLVTTYEYRKGKNLNSEVLVADSFHTRSDIFVSLSVILSLVVTKLGYPIVDPIIALGIAAAIAKVGIDIVRESSQVLTDMAALDLKLVEKLVMGIENVKGCHAIRTRGPAEDIYVDLHVEVLPELSAEEGHAVATKVEQRVKADLKGVADVIVHIEPLSES